MKKGWQKPYIANELMVQYDKRLADTLDCQRTNGAIWKKNVDRNLRLLTK